MRMMFGEKHVSFSVDSTWKNTMQLDVTDIAMAETNKGTHETEITEWASFSMHNHSEVD